MIHFVGGKVSVGIQECISLVAELQLIRLKPRVSFIFGLRSSLKKKTAAIKSPDNL
jgi:hypothetical protein